MFQVFVWVEAVFFGGLYDRVDDGTCPGSFGCVAEEPVFAADDERFDASFRSVVGYFESAVGVEGFQIRPLFQRVVYGFAQRRSRQRVCLFSPGEEFVRDLFALFKTLRVSCFRRKLQLFVSAFEREEFVAVFKSFARCAVFLHFRRCRLYCLVEFPSRMRPAASEFDVPAAVLSHGLVARVAVGMKVPFEACQEFYGVRAGSGRLVVV